MLCMYRTGTLKKCESKWSGSGMLLLDAARADGSGVGRREPPESTRDREPGQATGYTELLKSVKLVGYQLLQLN